MNMNIGSNAAREAEQCLTITKYIEEIDSAKLNKTVPGKSKKNKSNQSTCVIQ